MMSYGADEAEPYRRIAFFVTKILKAPSRPDIPLEQPTEFEFIISLIESSEADRLHDSAECPGACG